jgi:acyl-ACP thioesterase
VLPSALFNPQVAPNWQPIKLEASGPEIAHESISVQHSDLDLYNHVNNTSYIRWVENCAAAQGIFPTQLSVKYLSESKGGDVVHLTLLGSGNSPYFQGRVQDKLVFEAQIQFE